MIRREKVTYHRSGSWYDGMGGWHHSRSTRLKNPYGARCSTCKMSFSKSVKDSNSRLVRVVKYLRTRKGMDTTRADIVRDVFGLILADGKGEANPSTYAYIRGRSWSSGFFALGVATDFFRMTRKGNTTVYTLGKRARLIK